MGDFFTKTLDKRLYMCGHLTDFVSKVALVIRDIFRLQGGIHMNAQFFRDKLMESINEVKENLEQYVKNPGHDLTRSRKLPFEKIVTSLLAMGGRTLSNELLDIFGCSLNTVSSAAFVQQRAKLSPRAFEDLFHRFWEKTSTGHKLYKGYRLLAVDGSDVQIARNPSDKDSFIQSKKDCRPYNLLHLNVMYDILERTYTDAIVQKCRLSSENRALTDMVDRSSITQPVIVMADRGYESYNNLAHIQEKNWNFLIRIKDIGIHKTGILHGFTIPDSDEFDMDIALNITRKQTKEIKELIKHRNGYRWIPSNVTFDYLPVKNRKHEPVKMYELKLRIVRFRLTENAYEVIVTNLKKDEFPPDILKYLYGLRWGVETSFRDLKYTIGLLHFHSKKVEFIFQEIYSRLIMYNFSEMITSHVVIKVKNRKYAYKINFSAAVHICREFFLGRVPPLDVEALVSKYLTPVRPDRSRPRNMAVKTPVCFIYRIA